MIRFILLIVVLSFSCRPVLAQSSSVQQDSLDTTILINPNDLLSAIPEWNVATTDGFTYLVNSGYYGFYGPQPTVMLDGIPIDFSYFNWQNFNMLPTSIDFIEQITYSSDPQIYHQTLARAGFLNLSTSQPDTGFHAYGSFAVGNQIEDPGPWSYDSSKVTPNIDRRGPHYFSRFSYRSSNWYAKTQFSLRQHQPTNLNNNHRIGSYSYVNGVWHPVKTIIKNGLAEVGYSSNSWQFKTRALYSTNEEYVFFQPFGREVPATTRYAQIAAQGQYTSGQWTFKTRYMAHQKDMGYRVNNKLYNFDWNQLRHNLSLSSSYRGDRIQIQSGVDLEYATTNGLQLDNQQALATLWESFSYRLSPGYSLHSALHVDIATHETAPSASIEMRNQLTDNWMFTTAINYTELLHYRQQSSTYWVQRGYKLYEQLGILQYQPFSSQKNKSTGITLANTFELAPATKLTLKGTYLHHSALNIPWQIVSHDKQLYTGIYTHPQDLEFTSEQGDRLQIQFSIDQQLGRLLSHRLMAFWDVTTDGTERYRAYWQQTPEGRLNYQLKIRPVSDLAFSMMASYRSATTWREYQNLEGEPYRSLQPQYPLQYGTFHMQTPSFLKLDVTAKKWFWDRRLATTFSVRNLLNTEVRYHTLGLDKALQFIIKASVAL